MRDGLVKKTLLLAPVAVAALASAWAFAAPPADPLAVKLLAPDGTSVDVAGLASGKATVLVFVGTECPRTAKYAGRIAGFAKQYASRGVAVIAVDPNATDKPEAIRTLATDLGVTTLIDADQKLADAVGVKAVPCAVVLDGPHAVKYRGALDDNKVEAFVRHHHVDEALAAVLADKPVETAETPVTGCVVRRATAPSNAPTVTWATHVAPVVFKNCTPCHRPGQVAPFALVTYEQAKTWAQDLKAVALDRSMPPWKATEGGPFRDARHLTDEEVALLGKWADEGAPRGDPALEPAPPALPADGWALGEPDMVLTGEEYSVPATGEDEYRCFVLDPKLTEDRWVSALELRPGNRSVVHHILGYVDGTGISAMLDKKDPLPGYRSPGTSPGFPPDGEMGGWAPGNQPYALPEGVGRYLPKGSKIVLQVHYHKNGKVERDRSAIGLHFAKGPIDKPLKWIEMVDTRFRIPAGANAHVVKKTKTIGRAVNVLAVIPHAHLIARQARLEAELPDGTKIPLIGIGSWDFNWQDTYSYQKPLRLPAGTKITGTMIFDNSDANPTNPNRPAREVGWGEQTTDEMFLFYVGFVDVKSDKPAAPPAEKPAPPAEKPPENQTKKFR